MAILVTFGELLLRLSCPEMLRFTQTDRFDVGIAGAEANAAVACSALGHQAKFVSALPDNGMGEMATRRLRTWDVEPVIRRVPGGRMGLYYFEPGVTQRSAEIIYDRAGSAFASTPADAYDWPELLRGAAWFHTSGINPALSPEVAETTRQAMATARAMGIPVSFDPNYRAKLWTLEDARNAIEPLMPHVSVLISGTGQIGDLFGIRSSQADFEGAEEVARTIGSRYGISRVMIPRRGRGHGRIETRAAVFLDGGQVWRTDWKEFEMIDPLGGGDAFAGALIASLLDGADGQTCADFAVAAACVKHSVQGDLFAVRKSEVERFVRNGAASGVSR